MTINFKEAVVIDLDRLQMMLASLRPLIVISVNTATQVMYLLDMDTEELFALASTNWIIKIDS